MTRPKPTIYGNCDSWSFIVGKKPGTYSQCHAQKGSLQTSNTIFIHKLSTELGGKVWDNMWAICGLTVHAADLSRIVDFELADMPVMANLVARFYPKRSLGSQKVSGCKLNGRKNRVGNFGSRPVFFF